MLKQKADRLAKVPAGQRKRYQQLQDLRTEKMGKVEMLQGDIKRYDDAVGAANLKKQKELIMQRQKLEDEIANIGKEIRNLTK
jgi:hypothetical protein